MAEYVDRRRIYEEACEGCWYHGDEPGMCLSSEPCERLVVAFSSARASDVAPVAHGRWEFLGPNRLIKECMCGNCSVCKVRSKYIVNTMLCPNCGAMMDGAE